MSTADLTAAMSIEALHGTDQVFRPEFLEPLRPHEGQTLSAANMMAALRNSAIMASHKDSDHLVQDAYSLRCAPQVTGAARDAVQYAHQVASRELRAAIDNPVVLDSGSVSSNGNFHGAPLADALDFLAIVTADVASIAERRTDRMMDVHRNQGLPPFLAHDPGVDSGLMIAHYTQAAMVSASKRLATPATGAIVDRLRTRVPAPGTDRFLSPELAEATELVSSGAVVSAARKVIDVHHTLTQ